MRPISHPALYITMSSASDIFHVPNLTPLLTIYSIHSSLPMLSSTLLPGEIHNTTRAHRAHSLAAIAESLDNLTSPPIPGPHVTTNGKSSPYMHQHPILCTIGRIFTVPRTIAAFFLWQRASWALRTLGIYLRTPDIISTGLVPSLPSHGHPIYFNTSVAGFCDHHKHYEPKLDPRSITNFRQ